MNNIEVISKAALHIVTAIKQNNYKDDISQYLNFLNASEDEAINTVAWCILNNKKMHITQLVNGGYDIL